MANPENIPQNIRLNVSQAARLFGVSDRTIRRALARHEIRYVVSRNRYQLNFESLLAWSQQSTHLMNKLNRKGMGQWVEKWKINNPKYSPRPPAQE
jgi:excisionase family DNA binding protein